MNFDTPVIATFRPDDLSTAALRDALLRDPHVAYALTRFNKRRAPVAAVGQALLAWTGRVGTTFGRRAGEQHFLRVIPYLRSDAVTDVVVLGADALRMDGLSLLFDAVHAAGSRVWALLDPAAPADVVEWMANYLPGGLTSWDRVETYWDNRTDVPDLCEACPAAGDLTWLRAEPLTWPPVEECPVHTEPFACIREAVRRGVARSELTAHEARAVVGRLLAGHGDDVRAAADDLLGVDVYRPACRAVGELAVATGASLELALADVAADGGTITRPGRPPLSVPAGLTQRALARQRAHTLLAGGPTLGPLLTIFGEGGYW